MPDALSDADWEDLLELIRDGRCTPFIGAGASKPPLPLGSEIAQDWAKAHGYPLPDASDLARVAQYLAITKHGMYPKDAIRKQFQDVGPPDFSEADEPHAVLADLKLPIYITTNYDDFMVKALEDRKQAYRREVCHWNRFQEVAGEQSIFDEGYLPTPSEPLVYHLHGHTDLAQSMVLTESDYLDFVIRLSRDQDLLPPPIRKALAGTALLFVGYSLMDWNFRVVLRGLVGSLGGSLGYPGIAVQLPPGDLSGKEMEQAQAYLDDYFDEIQKIKVRIHWGDARQFARELRQRWEA
jgi:hypothetical protein